MAAEERRAEDIVRAQTPLLLGIENRKRKGTGKGGPDNGRFNFKGVRQRVSGKWVAEITVPKMPGIRRTRKWLGTFATAQDAALAYEQAAFALNGSPVQLNGSRAHLNDLHPPSYSAECPPVSSDSTTLGPLLPCPPALNPCPDPQTLTQPQHPFLLSSFNQSGAAVQVNPILGGAMLLPATSMQTNNQNLHQLALPQSAMNSEQALNVAATMQPLSGFQVSGAMLPAMQHYTSNIHEDLASGLFSFEGHYTSNIHEDLASDLFSLEGLPAVTTKSQPPDDLCKSHGVAACMTVMDQVPPFPDFNWDLEKARKDHLGKAMETMDDENPSMWDSDDPFGSMWGF